MSSLFKTYELDIVLLKKATLRNDIDKEDHVISEEFLFRDTTCAVAANETSQDSVLFIRIDSEEEEALELLTDIVFLVVKNILQANTKKNLGSETMSNI